MFILSAAALVTNVWVFAAHVRTIVSKRRNPLTQEVHRRAWGNRAALLHGCPPIAPPVQVGGQPHSLKAFSRQEAARKGLSKFL